MKNFRIVLWFLAILLALFIINGVFFAVIVFVKLLKLVVIAALITFICYLFTKEDKKKDDEGL